MNCIYCPNVIDSNNSSIEHVFPKSFGCPDDWTLDCVCADCNNKFGRTIERWLASDSAEAVKRLQKLGSKSKKRVRPKRLSISIPEEEKYGVFQGAKMWLDFSHMDNVLFPAQVGLLDDKRKRKFFTREDLHHSKMLAKAKSLSKKDMVILGSSQNDHDEMVDFVKNLKIIKEYNIKTQGGLPEGVVENNRILLDTRVKIDLDIQRAIAKIAINYLAKIKEANFVLKPYFDQIRAFVNGAIRGRFVTPDSEPILYDESKRFKHFDGHIFVFNRDGNQLISKISLFNELSYKVILAEDLGSIWYPIKSGHAFNIYSLKIIPVFSASKRLLPALFNLKII